MEMTRRRYVGGGSPSSAAVPLRFVLWPKKDGGGGLFCLLTSPPSLWRRGGRGGPKFAAVKSGGWSEEGPFAGLLRGTRGHCGGGGGGRAKRHKVECICKPEGLLDGTGKGRCRLSLCRDILDLTATRQKCNIAAPQPT